MDAVINFLKSIDFGTIQALTVVIGTLILILVLANVRESDGIIEAFSGSSDIKLFQDRKERGAEKRSTRLTNILIITLVVILLVSAMVIK